MYLLDVNTLIALGDTDHVHHLAAIQFHQEHAIRLGWATCPLTENGFLRIYGHSNYPLGPGSTAAARSILRSLTSSPGHEFWPDDFSLVDGSVIPVLPPSKNLADIYLLALAIRRGAKLVSFDRRIDPALVTGGNNACIVTPAV